MTLSGSRPKTKDSFSIKFIITTLTIGVLSSFSDANILSVFDGVNFSVWGVQTVIVYTDDIKSLDVVPFLIRESQTMFVQLIYQNSTDFADFVVRIDADHSTAVIVDMSLNNLRRGLDELSLYLHSLDTTRINGTLLWDPMYFVLWPMEPLSLSNNAMENEKFSTFYDFLRTFASNFSFNSDVYWIREEQSKDLGSSIEAGNKINTSGTNLQAELWETYGIKSMPFVKKVCAPIIKSCFTSLLRWKLERRKNFNRVPIIATAVADPVYSHEASFITMEDGTVRLQDGGSVVEYYHLMRDRLNFTEGSLIGEYMLEGEENSTVEEMQIYLYDGRADVAITESGIAQNKAEIVHFLHATTANRLKASLSHVPSTKRRFFLEPFSRDVWLAILVYCFLFAVSMTTAKRLKPRCFYHKVRRLAHTLSTGYLSLVWAIGTLCQQGWHKWPKRYPLKLLIVVASSSGFMILTAYSAQLTSQLAVKAPTEVTFEKLLNSSFTYYIENDFDFPADETKYSVRKTILYGIIESVPLVRGLLNEPKKALISYPEFFYAATVRFGNMSEAQLCESFTSIPTSYYPVPCAMAVRKWSPLKDLLNNLILRSYQQGTWHRTNQVYGKKTELRCEASAAVVPQTVGELTVAYGALLVGSAVSLTFFCIEILCYQCSWARNAKSSMSFLSDKAIQAIAAINLK